MGELYFRWCIHHCFVLIADELAQNKTTKILFFLFSVCIGAIQFFFGYVEIYALPALSVLLYFYTGVLYIKRRISVAVPIIILLLAVGLHLLSVGLIPSVITLLFYQKIVRYKIKIIHFIFLLILATPIVYIAASIFDRAHVLIPFTQNNPQLMTLLSVKHLWEFFNSQMLAGGLGFALFVVLLFKKIKYDNILWFLSIGGLGMLYVVFINRSDRGSGDWDLCAFPAIACSLTAIYIIVNFYWSKPFYKYIIPIIIAFNGMNVIAWIGINTSDRSITKIEDMLAGDPAKLLSQTFTDV